MAYQVDKFNGTFLVSVADGTIDATTDLRFVGKNYAGYGEVQNENFLHLLESFANTTAPPKPVAGQIWFDSANKKLKYYDGNKFKIASGAEVATIAPTGLTIGDFWFDSSSGQLYAYNGSEFVLIGPEIAPESGTAGVVAEDILDISDVRHSIVKVISAGSTIAVFSRDAFTPKDTSGLPGFPILKKGVNLINTNPETGITSTDHYFWGTASNSLKLEGYGVEDFILAGSASLPSGSKFPDGGFYLGDDNDIRFWVPNGNDPSLVNQLNGGVIKIITTESGSAREIAIFKTTGFAPGADNIFDIGENGARYKTIYATTFNGSLTGNVTGNLSGLHTGNVLAADSSVIVNSSTKTVTATFSGNLTGTVNGNLIGTATNATQLDSKTSSTSAVADTVCLRDNSGNISAVNFIGIGEKSDRLKIDDAATDTDPNYRSAKTTKTANTIAARDGSGNLLANVFDGTATAAQYADLAEKYLADKEYETGTVVMVGGDAEVTACVSGARAIGVVSANPAFMMNKDLEGGTYIALKGRVPVKVTGPIKKGMRLRAGPDGTAVRAGLQSRTETFAIALESSDETAVKIIEAIIL